MGIGGVVLGASFLFHGHDKLRAGIEGKINAVGPLDVLGLEILDVEGIQDGGDGGDRLGLLDRLGGGAGTGGLAVFPLALLFQHQQADAIRSSMAFCSRV